MLDTNIFNLLLDDEKFSLELLPNADGFLATPVQWKELCATKCYNRRLELCSKFDLIAPDIISVSFSWNVRGAGFDEGEWATEEETALYKSLKNVLDRITKEKGKCKKENNIKDVLIAVCAIKHEAKLVTSDPSLKEAIDECGFSRFVEYFPYCSRNSFPS